MINLKPPKSWRPRRFGTIDSVAVRKRAASKGDLIVEVKSGEEITSVNVAWDADRYVKEEKVVEKKEVKKAAPAKKTARANVKAKPAAKKKKK